MKTQIIKIKHKVKNIFPYGDVLVPVIPKKMKYKTYTDPKLETHKQEKSTVHTKVPAPRNGFKKGCGNIAYNYSDQRKNGNNMDDIICGDIIEGEVILCNHCEVLEEGFLLGSLSKEKEMLDEFKSKISIRINELSLALKYLNLQNEAKCRIGELGLLIEKLEGLK